MGMSIQRVRVEEEQVSIPGIGSGYTVLDFLETAEQGNISDIIELDETFILVHVDEIVPEGYQPFEEVQTEIEPRAYIEKKKEVLVERLERAYRGRELRQSFQRTRHPGAERLRNLRIECGARTRCRTLVRGHRPRSRCGSFLGIVAGDNTVFALRVTQVNEPAPIMENEQENIRQQLLQQRQNAVRTQWMHPCANTRISRTSAGVSVSSNSGQASLRLEGSPEHHLCGTFQINIPYAPSFQPDAHSQAPAGHIHIDSVGLRALQHTSHYSGRYRPRTACQRFRLNAFLVGTDEQAIIVYDFDKVDIGAGRGQCFVLPIAGPHTPTGMSATRSAKHTRCSVPVQI